MGGAVLLSCWLFGVRHPALEPKSSWVELSLGVEMNMGEFMPVYISWSQDYLVVQHFELGSLTLKAQAWALAGNQDPANCTAQPKKKKKTKKKTREQQTKQKNSKIKTNSENKT